MKLSTADYVLVRFASAAQRMLRTLGEMESTSLRARLQAIPINQPVFITGLARSGTTILLEQLVRTELFATHCYRDFPFLSIPYWWNKYLGLVSAGQQPVERPHQDRISITANSPEAFEEPTWHQFFPHIHSAAAVHRLDANTSHVEFEKFFRDHLRKIMLVRKCNRYLSKGNYNVTRLEYLGKLFPDAQFVIPIRHPLDHVRSLVRQHRLFTEYAESDSRIATYLACAGHFEFGPQRQAIRLNKIDGDRTDDAWRAGHEYLGYAIQWSQVYRYIDELRHAGNDLACRIHVIRYEDFCAQPRSWLSEILTKASLPTATLDRLEFGHISRSVLDVDESPTAADTVWKETGLVAQLFGYAEIPISAVLTASPTVR